MTFREVLPYWDPTLAKYLEDRSTLEEIPAFFVNDLIPQFKKYLITGGMPAVINAFNLQTQFQAVENVLQNI